MSCIFIGTASGKRFDFIEQQAANVCIEDIAYSLSNICRFNGHPNRHYSVAQHCLFTSSLADNDRMALLLLLHDAHEAYLSDIPTPVVSWLNIIDDRFRATLKLAKRLLDKTIFEALGVDLPTDNEAKIIRKIDDITYVAEAMRLGMYYDKRERPELALMNNYWLGQHHKDDIRNEYIESFNELKNGKE